MHMFSGVPLFLNTMNKECRKVFCMNSENFKSIIDSVFR